MNEIAAAYSQGGEAWQAGPGRIYDVLSEHLVAHSPVDLAGRRVLDLGAGTGAATRALLRRGACPIAVDVAEGMLRTGAANRPPATLGDALALPLRTGAVDGVVAAYSLNHLLDPVMALREAARVTTPGGPILAAAYASDDRHPVKSAVDHAAAEAGFQGVGWYDRMRADAVPRLASTERAESALQQANLSGHAVHERISFPELGPRELVDWRVGTAQLAPFVATLAVPARERLVRRALELLGEGPPTLERSVITLVAVAGASPSADGSKARRDRS
jgi:ubiquinone/menaquinone biosynthesis C-methylase UbiE